MDPNIHGLKRYIPADKARIIRNNAGFGCAICGAAFYKYEHFDPLFIDATEHNPNGITLLCGGCEDSKTRGRISVQEVREAAANPKCLQVGFSHGALRFGRKDAVIEIGDNQFINPEKILTINGETILSISKPENESAPFLLTFIPSGKPNGNKIINNEWFGDIDSWDITTVGRVIEVRNEEKKIILQIENIPDEKFILHKIDINYKGYQVSTSKIGRKGFGSLKCPEEDIFTIRNTMGQEILRLGRKGETVFKIDWPNALEVVGEYMNPHINSMNLTGATMHYIVGENTKGSISNTTLTNIYFKIGQDERIHPFMTRLMKYKNPNSITKWDKEFVRDQYNILKHTGIINQLMPNDMKNLQALLGYFKVKV